MKVLHKNPFFVSGINFLSSIKQFLKKKKYSKAKRKKKSEFFLQSFKIKFSKQEVKKQEGYISKTNKNSHVVNFQYFQKIYFT